MLNLLLIQYYFTGEEHSIVKLPHGNSKSVTPYKRTQGSVMNRLKDLCTKMDSVATMETIDSDVGDIVGQTSSGSRLRNIRQVTNARRKLRLDGGCKSQLAEAMEMCKTGIGSKGIAFVRSVIAAPEPMCILTTDRQLDEMVRNCTDPSHFVTLGVDPTFKLGPFYATPTVFPLRMLVSKQTGKSPAFLGPVLIHQSQKFSSYYYFASQIIGLKRQLKDVRAIGTDGESALYDAFKSAFPSAVHLRCFNHVKQNIENKLRSLNLPLHVMKEITRDIFGLSLPTERQLCLVDSQNEIDFKEKLAALKPIWDQLEIQNRLCQKHKTVTPEFHRWFVQEKSQMMTKCMIREGMGRTDFKPHDIRPFVDKVFELVQAQESLLRKAVIRCDRWRFREEYRHLEVDQDKWFTMGEKTKSII